MDSFGIFLLLALFSLVALIICFINHMGNIKIERKLNIVVKHTKLKIVECVLAIVLIVSIVGVIIAANVYAANAPSYSSDSSKRCAICGKSYSSGGTSNMCSQCYKNYKYAAEAAGY